MKNLKELRKQRNLSQEALAGIFNKSQQTICKYENGRAEPDISELIQLARYFDVSVDYLIGNTDEVCALPAADRRDLNDEELCLLSRLRNLPDELKESYISMILAIGQEHPEQEAAE